MAEETKKGRTPEEKRMIQNKKRNLRNNKLRKSMRTEIKKFEQAVEGEKVADNAQDLLKNANKKIDKMVTKGIVHKNAAARKKSRLTRRLNKLSK